jgi:hypothetical protein
MDTKPKKIDIKEFREEGFVQELNRQFLHPLGMALEIGKDTHGNEYLNGIWDYRDDPEGIIYAIETSGSDRKNAFKRKYNNVQKLQKEKAKSRKEILGFVIEPVYSKKSKV